MNSSCGTGDDSNPPVPHCRPRHLPTSLPTTIKRLTRSLQVRLRSNHFCVDLSERLVGEGAWSDADARFIDERVLHESEAILNSLPGGTWQQSMTRGVTRQVQKIIIKSWRKEWKRALAEYEADAGIPVEQRISS